MEKNIVKTIKDCVITGVCAAFAGAVATKICESTDDFGERLKDKIFRTDREVKTIDQVFYED